MRNVTFQAVVELFEIFEEPEHIERLIEEISEHALESPSTDSLEAWQRSNYANLCNNLTRVVYYLFSVYEDEISKAESNVSTKIS